MKNCTVCKNLKPFESFAFIRVNKNGSNLYRGKCHECYNEHYREKHRRKSDVERKNVYQERKAKTTFVSRKNDRLIRIFGITIDTFDEMLREQNGRCYICSKPFSDQLKANIDHNHNTGQVRKLLCSPCNTTLGLLNENPEIFDACISYLNEHNDSLSQI
jgi:hypothetical protein